MNPLGFIKKGFDIFKKKSAAPARAADAPFEHDDNVVLVFGHSNAGKTVYFSVLYELLKGNESFKLSPLNNETAANLIENYNLMRGKLLKIREGRQVEIEGERKFPTMTSETRILKFGLDMNIRKGVKFYTVDYKGETLSIAEPGELRKQFAKFFPFARAALFFIDASVLETDVLLREQIAAFQTILHDLRDCAPKRMPVGIVITKADFLEGFSPSNPVELIPPNAAIYKGRRKDAFISGLNKINQRRVGEVWARSCERVSRTLGNLIDSISAYNLDFQFFFVSATGGLEKTSTGGVAPPRDIKPSGIADPLMWAFGRILFNKRKWFWGYLVKWVFALCLMWALFFTAVNLFHWYSLYDRLDKAEEKRKEKLRPGPDPIPDNAFNQVRDLYKDYLGHIPVNDFFGARELREYAQSRMSSIDNAKYAQADSIEKLPAGKKPKVVKHDDDEKTAAARVDWGEVMKGIKALPPDQQGAELDKKIAKFFEEHPKDSLDKAFVKEVENSPDALKQASADLAKKEFQFELTVSNIPPQSKVSIHIGDQSIVDFSNTSSSTPIVSAAIKAVGTAPITFDLVDYSLDKQYEQKEDKPLEAFYPKIKVDGYKLDFQTDKGIVVKWKSGEIPSQ